MTELIIFVLTFVFEFAMIPITVIIGGRGGLYTCIFVALTDITLVGAMFAGGDTITNALLCGITCGTTPLYPYIFIPLILAIVQFVILITKRY